MEDYAFAVRDIEQKGKGAVACRMIPRGTLILAEAPLFAIPRYGIAGHVVKALIATELQKLDKDSQRLFFQLQNSYSNISSFEGIVKTNALPLGKHGRQGAIFPTCSRFNHSCVANAAYSWQAGIHREVIYALQDIQQGDEITVSYLSDDAWALPRTERRRHLQQNFNFNCACGSCHSHPTEALESDGRRLKLSRLQGEVGNGILIMSQPKRALAYCSESIDLLRAEGESAPMEQTVYYDAFQVCAAHSDFARARAFADLSTKCAITWQGAESEETQTYQNLAKKPMTHRLAGYTALWKSMANEALSPTSPEFCAWLWQPST